MGRVGRGSERLLGPPERAVAPLNWTSALVPVSDQMPPVPTGTIASKNRNVSHIFLFLIHSCMSYPSHDAISLAEWLKVKGFKFMCLRCRQAPREKKIWNFDNFYTFSRQIYKFFPISEGGGSTCPNAPLEPCLNSLNADVESRVFVLKSIKCACTFLGIFSKIFLENYYGKFCEFCSVRS